MLIYGPFAWQICQERSTHTIFTTYYKSLWLWRCTSLFNTHSSMNTGMVPDEFRICRNHDICYNFYYRIWVSQSFKVSILINSKKLILVLCPKFWTQSSLCIMAGTKSNLFIQRYWNIWRKEVFCMQVPYDFVCSRCRVGVDKHTPVHKHH